MKKRLLSVILSLTFAVTACAEAPSEPPATSGETAAAATSAASGETAATATSAASGETATTATSATSGETAATATAATATAATATATTATATTATATAATAATVKPVETREFAEIAADFTAEVFKRAYAEGKGKNCLTSPLSVMLALSMTANGANGETLSEMEKTFGSNISVLNQNISDYVKFLPSTKGAKLSVANSIWYRDGFRVLDGFLSVNTKYYRADIRKSAFDNKAKNDINGWVKEKTDGMIDSVINEIPSDVVMYLINAIAFDGKWEEEYKESQVRDRDFYSYGKGKQTAKMMYSDEDIYISDDNATGFIKPYKDGNYSFAALLPNAGVNIDDYVSSLTGESLIKTLNTGSYEKVAAGLPKFKCEYGITMNSLLKAMGINKAFDPYNADFSKLGSSPNDNIFISEVFHKTFIEVDEKGTKAAAVTVVVPTDTSSPMPPKTVILDRPFVCAIIDNSTNLPVFIGVLTEIPD